MSTTKHKPSKNKFEKIDQEDNRKFMLILVIATVALMIGMYLIFS